MAASLIPKTLNPYQLVNNLIDAVRTESRTNGQGEFVPALFDLIDELTRHYENDVRIVGCDALKDKIRNELLQVENQEQQDRDYQRRVDASVANEGLPSDNWAEQWMNEAAGNVDEFALRLTLAVFNGANFEVIERAKDDLSKLLEPLMLIPKTESLIPVVAFVPLMGRIRAAGGQEIGGEPPHWKRGVVLDPTKAKFAPEAIRYVWQEYREAEWRETIMQWLTEYTVGESAEVRTCVAVAVGILGIQDYRYVVDNLLKNWIRKSLDEGTDNRTAAQYRMAVAMVLGVLARSAKLTSEVQHLLRKWSVSRNSAERWVSIRAYIYVGTYCEPISDVIECWRHIASGLAAKYADPMYMSLMDAMNRFFVKVAQLPEVERREKFKGILEGLRKWIADKGHDAALGLFMFTTLVAAKDENPERPPLLVHLIRTQKDHDDYSKQLAMVFGVLLNDVTTVIEARDLLCMWARWIDGLEDNSGSYELRMQLLLKEIIAQDQTGRMRGRLINCLRDCGRNSLLERILVNL
jgi:hypothetical protein